MPSKPQIRVTGLSEEDRTWIAAQSDALGFDDEALVVRMLIRDARKKGVSFAMVAVDPKADVTEAYKKQFVTGSWPLVAPSYPAAERASSNSELWHKHVLPEYLRENGLPIPVFNEPAQDFDFGDAEAAQSIKVLAEQASADTEPADPISDTLSQTVSAVDAMLASAMPADNVVPHPAAAGASTYRNHRAQMRGSTHLRSPRGPQPAFDGPGSRTMVVGSGYMGHVDERELTPAQRVQRGAYSHFYSR